MTSPVAQLAREARTASHALRQANAEKRGALLRAIADALEEPQHRSRILEANAADVADGEKSMAEGKLSEALVRRLILKEDKLATLCEGLRQLADQDDGVGRRLQHRELDEGLVVEQLTIPLGVLGIIFESRPDAVPQIAGLALRTGNAVLLKGGKEATRSNRALVDVIRAALTEQGLPEGCVTYLESREEVAEMLECDKDIDLIIARGSGAFVEHIMGTSKIPVLGHAEGLCHVLIDANADPEMAARILVDAKTSYPAACNAVETILWVEGGEVAIRAGIDALLEAGVEVRACPRTRSLSDSAKLSEAGEVDWSTEYSDLIVSVKHCPNLDDALAHIDRFGSKHTEAIITPDKERAERFLQEVDAAGVYHNASTRFADGYRLGLGAEVGISTSKLHARGPVGIDGLLTTVWRLRGQGQVSTDYGPGKRSYTHRDL